MAKTQIGNNNNEDKENNKGNRYKYHMELKSNLTDEFREAPLE